MSNKDRHDKRLATKFDKEETARRERMGKMTEAPQPPAQLPQVKEINAPTEPRFDISSGERA